MDPGDGLMEVVDEDLSKDMVMGGRRERAPASISSLKMKPCTLNGMHVGQHWSG